MIERRPGEAITLETKAEANETIDRNLRYKQILEIMREYPNDAYSAKEIAVKMYIKGYIPSTERNFTAPRLTELGKRGIVEPIGKKTCTYTGKTVTVWALREA